MWKYLKFLFSPKKKKRVQFALPEPKQEDSSMELDEEIKAMVNEISNSNAPAELIEQQITMIEDSLEKKGRTIVLFHKAVVDLRNERCEDPSLETELGTRKALRELSIYANQITCEFKGIKVKDPQTAKTPDMKYYWSV